MANILVDKLGLTRFWNNAKSYIDTTKQDLLVSGTNIKTINNMSLLGSGGIEIAEAVSVIIPNTSWYTSVDSIFADIAVTGVTAMNDVIIAVSGADKVLCAKYGISVEAQLSGSLRFKANSFPSENITVRVLIIN